MAKPHQQYRLLINEEQRRIIEQALNNIPPNTLLSSEDEGQTQEHIIEEHQMLVAMLREVPEHEAKDPGILHGLCL